VCGHNAFPFLLQGAYPLAEGDGFPLEFLDLLPLADEPPLVLPPAPSPRDPDPGPDLPVERQQRTPGSLALSAAAAAASFTITTLSRMSLNRGAYAGSHFAISAPRPSTPGIAGA